MMKIPMTMMILFMGIVSAITSPPETCSTKLAFSSNLIPFDISSLSCYSAWKAQDFILLVQNSNPKPPNPQNKLTTKESSSQYKEEKPELWSFVLSAPEDNAYVAIGFSPNGKMVGSSAIAGWISSNGKGIVKQYSLRGTDSRYCPPDQGSLQLIPGSSLILKNSSRLYIAFQLNTSEPLSNLIYALGPRGNLPGSDFYLPEHRSEISTVIDYSTGLSSGDEGSDTLHRAHGLVNLIGWGVLMPIGMIVARHCKSWDPTWFYSHLVIQGVGFALGIAGIVTGFKLEDEEGEVNTHKALGIFILVAGSLQATALLARPGKEAKMRKYWNFYHHNLGRIAVAFAVGNIFYGLALADEESSWKIGYGVFLGLWFLLSLILEVRSHART